MKTKFKHYGFSLVEVLMAVGILAVGLLLIATMFPAAIYMTSVASERTMAAIVADEAFAKIRIYDINETEDPCICYDYEQDGGVDIPPVEFAYPPVDPCGSSQYYWSALFRKLSDNQFDRNYQITVFAARKTNPGLTYEGTPVDRPVPISRDISGSEGDIEISVSSEILELINPPTNIVDNETGKIYAVVKKDISSITLDRKLESEVKEIWLIPPPQSGGKSACVGVYQRIIKF